MTDRELMQMALDTFNDLHNNVSGYTALWRGAFDREIALLERRLAQPEPEPVAWMTYESEHRLRSGGNHRGAVPVHQKSSREAKIPLYAAPPQREWKGLTDEEIKAMRHMRDWTAGWTDIKYAREIEAKLKLKNGYAEEKNT